MYRFNQLSISLGPTVFPQTDDGTEYYVCCHAIADDAPSDTHWLSSHDFYLHADGLWRVAAIDEHGRSASFNTRGEAEAALYAIQKGMPMGLHVIVSNIEAQALASREHKFKFR